MRTNKCIEDGLQKRNAFSFHKETQNDLHSGHLHTDTSHYSYRWEPNPSTETSSRAVWMYLRYTTMMGSHKILLQNTGGSLYIFPVYPLVNSIVVARRRRTSWLSSPKTENATIRHGTPPGHTQSRGDRPHTGQSVGTIESDRGSVTDRTAGIHPIPFPGSHHIHTLPRYAWTKRLKHTMREKPSDNHPIRQQFCDRMQPLKITMDSRHRNRSEYAMDRTRFPCSGVGEHIAAISRIRNAHESNNQLPLTPIQRNLEIVVAENDLGKLHFPFSTPSRLMNSPTYHKLIDRRW